MARSYTEKLARLLRLYLSRLRDELIHLAPLMPRPKPALWAKPLMLVNVMIAIGLQKRFCLALETVCAKCMRRFALFHSFFRYVGEQAGVEIFQFVALLICIPCFKCSHFFFKLAYALQQRRALILCCERGVVSVDELGLKFDELRLKGRTIPQALSSLARYPWHH